MKGISNLVGAVIGVIVLVLIFNPKFLQKAPKQESMGRPFTVGQWTYHVMAAHWTTRLGTGAFQQAANARFLVVHLWVTNNDTSPSTLPPMALVDSLGQEHSSSVIFGAPEISTFGVLENLNPGVSKSGDVVFDVPGYSTYRLRLSGGFGSGSSESAEVPLNPS